MLGLLNGLLQVLVILREENARLLGCAKRQQGLQGGNHGISLIWVRDLVHVQKGAEARAAWCDRRERGRWQRAPPGSPRSPCGDGSVSMLLFETNCAQNGVARVAGSFWKFETLCRRNAGRAEWEDRIKSVGSHRM